MQFPYFMKTINDTEEEPAPRKHAAKNYGSKNYDYQVEVIDLRTLVPLDEEAIFESVKKHGRCIVLTEEQVSGSFAQSISGLISEHCFEYLDAPVRVLGAKDMPAIPLNSNLEAEMLPSSKKLQNLIDSILSY